MPESEQLSERYTRCKKWMASANEILRRTSARGRAGAPKLTAADVEVLLAEAAELQLEQVEIEQVLEKLDEAKVWAAEAAELLSSGRSVGELAMVQLLELQARAEQIPIALEQLAVLEERVTRLQSWQARAKTALDARNAAELPKAVGALVAEAAELGISLGDLAHLSSHLAYHTWGEQAAKALKTTVPLQRLQTLCELTLTLTLTLTLILTLTLTWPWP